MRNKASPPNINPTKTFVKLTCKLFTPSIAGFKREKYEEQSIIPAASARKASCTFKLSFLKKITTKAPRNVKEYVINPAKDAYNTYFNILTHNTICNQIFLVNL